MTQSHRLVIHKEEIIWFMILEAEESEKVGLVSAGHLVRASCFILTWYGHPTMRQNKCQLGSPFLFS